ncbi:hypothetical protein [Pantoea stewartii]|uniref:hypothetical protein n=1 Tax=Pantoea stewartii TaxID=66269 RepID=UPI0016278BFE|nr:hypothetical protein [Pantoea stewartii]MBC0853169.1 hypothetical protein [Pantoea stewartii]
MEDKSKDTGFIGAWLIVAALVIFGVIKLIVALGLWDFIYRDGGSAILTMASGASYFALWRWGSHRVFRKYQGWTLIIFFLSLFIWIMKPEWGGM